MAGTHNFVCEQGATFIRDVTPKDSAQIVRDLTGYSARMQVRLTAATPTTVLSLVSPTNITVGATGMTITIAATATAAVPAGCYVYDLEIEKDGIVERVIQGDFIVDAEVTR